MNYMDVRDWLVFGGSLASIVFGAGVMWTKLTTKIDNAVETSTKARERLESDIKNKASIDQLNGMSGRIEGVKEDCAAYGGAMNEFRRELGMYRQEARESTSILSRIEQSNLEIASRLAALGKDIVAMDKANSNRLTRLETVVQVEKKLGSSIPTD